MANPLFGEVERDQEVTGYISRGRLYLRLDENGNGLFLSIGMAAPGAVRMGIIAGYDPDNVESGTEYRTYVQDDPAAHIAGWPADPSHTITFGVAGFRVYVLIDGALAVDDTQGPLSYLDYRREMMHPGRPGLWSHSGVVGGPVFDYPTPVSLYSDYANGVFDPRDFGWRDLTTIDGGMAAGSKTLTLSSARDFRSGDQIIVEIGGEAGQGKRNTIGVGGITPQKHYADAAARDADTAQVDGTLAYIDSNGSVWISNAGKWSAFNLGGSYYVGVRSPRSLVARVTAVNGRTLTLDKAASIATSGANVWLDLKPALYPLTSEPAETFAPGRSDGLSAYGNMTLALPAGAFVVSGRAIVKDQGQRDNWTISGAGQNATEIRAARGLDSSLLVSSLNSKGTLKEFTWRGNLGDDGFGFVIDARGQFVDYSTLAIMTGGTGNTARNVGVVDQFGGGLSLSGTDPLIEDCAASFTKGQRAYLGWQFQLANATGGRINHCTMDGKYLVKSFEVFACNGAEIMDCGGVNALFASNSSTSCRFTLPASTITAGAYFDPGSGWLDEPVININHSAFGSSWAISVVDPHIVQSGYVDGVKESLKAIAVAHDDIADVTISGSYGGAGRGPGGYFEAPDYVSGAIYMGSVAVISDAPRTIVDGIRVVGAGKPAPGNSGHWDQVSVLGAGSEVKNCIVDTVQANATTGNRSNAEFGQDVMPITYAISGGADADKFSIDAATGVLTFKTAPDFENPGDADADNVYEVQVSATDAGGAATTQDLHVTVADVAENLPPQITSAADVSVNENQITVLTVTATDPDENAG